MDWRSKCFHKWSLWVIFIPGALYLTSGTPARADVCALPRAVIAGEITLRDALSRGDGNAAPLLSALARLARQANGAPEISAYLISRKELATTLAAGDGIVAQQLMRAPPHQLAGQQALLAVHADSKCVTDLSETNNTKAAVIRDGGQIFGGHGGVSKSGTDVPNGEGRASKPGGSGLSTSPLSFLRGFDTTLHIIPAIGATLAFGTLIFALTRNRRQYRRYLCHLPIEIGDPNGLITSTLLNISRGGAKLTHTGGWEHGARLTVRLEQNTASRSARVVWANEGFAGVLFRNPLTAAEFLALLNHAAKGAGVARRNAS
jgi:hypothetical protein